MASLPDNNIIVSDELRYCISNIATKIWIDTKNDEEQAFCIRYIYPSLISSMPSLQSFYRFLVEHQYGLEAKDVKEKLDRFIRQQKVLGINSEKPKKITM